MMSGEDVYVWCDLCDTAHDPCETPDDLTYECVYCNKPLPDATSDDPAFPMLECDDCHVPYPSGIDA